MQVSIAAASSGQQPAESRRNLGIFGFCLFSTLLLSPSIGEILISGVSAEQAQTALDVSIVYWAAWTAVWRNPYWACLAATPLLLLTPIRLYLLLRYHSPLSPQLLGVILETNFTESTEFLGEIWLLILTAYTLLAAFCCLALYWMRRYKLQWPLRWRLCTLFCASVTVGLLHFFDYSPGGQRTNAASGQVRWPRDLQRLRATSPFGDILEIADGLEAERKMDAVDRVKESFRFGATQTIGTNDSQVYVLIIGESSRKDSWHLYGYARQTSPRLESESNLITFSDVTTVASWTRASVPVILTRKRATQALDLQFSERSLVSAFREAGFATYWLSVQQPNGLHDSPFAAIAREAEHVAYFNPTGGWTYGTPWDGAMLEPLKKVLAKTSERRQLIILHTLGSHNNYQYRYPPEFDSFKPSFPKTSTLVNFNRTDASTLTNTYDNSILYTDYFVSEVIAAVRSSGRKLATVTYVSDHGENLFEAPCFLWGHPHLTAENIRIPLLFWYSEGYQQAFPHRIVVLKSHRTEPLTTEAVFPLVLGAAGIHFPGEDPTRCVVSDSFSPLPHRLVRSLSGLTIDFDRAHITDSCELAN